MNFNFAWAATTGVCGRLLASVVISVSVAGVGVGVAMVGAFVVAASVGVGVGVVVVITRVSTNTLLRDFYTYIHISKTYSITDKM